MTRAALKRGDQAKGKTLEEMVADAGMIEALGCIPLLGGLIFLNTLKEANPWTADHAEV